MRNPKSMFLVAIVLLLLVASLLLVHGWWIHRGPQPGTVLDEARQAQRPVRSFLVPTDDKYFRDMDQDKDGVVQLSPEESEGRNTWLVWTGGNDRLWNHLTKDSFGALDFLKTLSSYPYQISADPNDKMKFSRGNRWSYLGLVNEPCFVKATGPDPERFGLWLDKRIVSPDCPPDPFE